MEMQFCNRCLSRGMKTESVGYIPLPDIVADNRAETTRQLPIRVCQRHYDEALEQCFYVLRNDQVDDAGSAEFDKRSWAKHIAIRGSRQLGYRARL